jgi:5-methylcytosine-specific restriction endonuclease McrA
MGQPIDRICPICGKRYQADSTKLKQNRQTTCSRKCSYAFRAQNQSHAVECICQRCKKPFTTTPYRVEHGRGKYCSRECQYPPLVKTCPICKKDFRTPPSEDSTFCSLTCANLAPSRAENARRTAIKQWENPETRRRTLEGIKRRSQSEEWKSAPHFQKGERHPRYKRERRARQRLMSRYRYKVWRQTIFERCHFTCQGCGRRGVYLNAHHIKSWAEYPDQRYNLDNGIALCVQCHKKEHTK